MDKAFWHDYNNINIYIGRIQRQSLKAQMQDAMSYRNFRQDAPGLNETEAWPKSVFPDADYTYFRDCGCLVCSLAVMLRHNGIEKTEDEELFNPWILNRRLIDAGAFTSGADLIFAEIRKLYPLEYMGSMPYSPELLEQTVKSGSPSLITVPGIRSEKHFITPLSLISGDTVVFDPLYGEMNLREYGQIYEIRKFLRTDTSCDEKAV